MLEVVLQIWRQPKLKLNKDGCVFRCTSIAFFGKEISQYGVNPEPSKIQALMDIPPPKTKSCNYS